MKMKMKMMRVMIGLTLTLIANGVAAQESTSLPSELFDISATVQEADADARTKASAQRRYTSEYIHFDPTVEDRTAYRFADTNGLEGADFYNALGREDLAEAYTKKKSQKDFGVAMVVGGGLGLTVAGSMAVINYGVNLFSGFLPGGGGITANSNSTPLFIAGLSTAAMVTGLVVIPAEVHPVSVEEADRMVKQHNNGLKNRLGIPATYKRPGSQERSKLNVNMGVGSDGENGQLVLRVGF